MMHSRTPRSPNSVVSRSVARESATTDGRYLTDGTHLYRELARIDDVPEEVLLEDCHSLAVTVLSGAEAGRLSEVARVAASSPDGVRATGRAPESRS